MAASMTLLEETIERWYEVRRGLIKELNTIPATRLSFRATLETRSALELIQHVLEVSIMTVEELVREDTNLHRAPFPQLLHFYAPNIAKADTQEKLVDLLVEQYRDADQRLRKAGDIHLMQLVTHQDGTKATRLAALNEAVGHEMYHRGQLTVYIRLLGLEPALTQQQSHPAIPAIGNEGRDNI
jgi:uncharacterized damage-inducible protein DinB